MALPRGFEPHPRQYMDMSFCIFDVVEVVVEVSVGTVEVSRSGEAPVLLKFDDLGVSF